MGKEKSFDEKIEALYKLIDKSKNIVVLTGAGISVPSGIPDFRSSTGLYSTPYGDYSPETMISHDFFEAYPDEFYKFYKEKMLFPKAKANMAHELLAKLEKMGKLKAVITQNIDGLHQKGGSKVVYEIHGSVHRNYCVRCGKFFDLSYIVKQEGTPKCNDCGGLIKPDVVLYGESIDQNVLRKVIRAIDDADMFIVIGTSLVVYPAAGLLEYFEGNHLVLINKGATTYDGMAELIVNEDCAKVAEELMKKFN